MRRMTVIGVLLLGTLVTAGIVVAAGSSDPERPAWAGADGSLRSERLPAFFEVAGPDGAPVVCANGRRLRVPSASLFGLPPEPEVLLGQQRRGGGEEIVWRCGKGASPHLHSRPVPQSQDTLRAQP